MLVRWSSVVVWALVLACGGGGSTGDVAASDDAVFLDAADTADIVAGPDAPLDGGVDAAPVCAPTCPLAACGADDGCGALCAPCPTEQTCSDCPLALTITQRDDPFLFVALDFAPLDGAALPTLADLRVRIDGDATLLDLEVGQVVLDADKAPFPDPATGDPFQVDALADGGQVVRVVLGSTASTNTVSGGTWLTLRFRLGGAFSPLEAPVVFRLSTDEAVFAPPAAEQQLWGFEVDAPMAVWP